MFICPNGHFAEIKTDINDRYEDCIFEKPMTL